MVGADESTELWERPKNRFLTVYTLPNGPTDAIVDITAREREREREMAA